VVIWSYPAAVTVQTNEACVCVSSVQERSVCLYCGHQQSTRTSVDSEAWHCGISVIWCGRKMKIQIQIKLNILNQYLILARAVI